MADREISTLPAAEELQDEDLFVVRQNGEARKSTAAQLKTFVGTDVTDEWISSLGSLAFKSTVAKTDLDAELLREIEDNESSTAEAKAAAASAANSAAEAETSANRAAETAKKAAEIVTGATVSVVAEGTTLRFLSETDVPSYLKYTGAYEVQPQVGGTSVVLETENKVLTDNVEVYPVPQLETSNDAGGKTLTIGG